MYVLHCWASKARHLINQLVFILWSAWLTYKNGPYYTWLELCRNFQLFGARKLNYEQEFGKSLHGKVCVITGGTRGIGLEVTRFLYSKHCTIITGTSSLSASATAEDISYFKNKLVQEITKNANHKTETMEKAKDIKRIEDNLIVMPLDLTSMNSVVQFCNAIRKQFSSINYLICNGGVMFVPFQLTKDQFECHMSINYLGHCLLILKLLPLLNSAEAARIVAVSSGAHRASLGLRLHDLHSKSLFSVYHSYAQSKLALIMFTYRFDQWLKTKQDLNTNLTINCLHPGICRTGLMEKFNFFRFKLIQTLPLFRSANEGAETILYVTLSDKLRHKSGQYFENCIETQSSALSYQRPLQEQLWRRTWFDLKPWLTVQECQLLAL